MDCGKGQLVIAANDSKTLNEHAVQYAITGGRISGIDFRLWTGSLIRHLSASTTLTSERCIVGPAHLGFSKANATNVLTCNAYLFNGGLCSLSVGSQTITLNNPTFIGCTTSGPPVLGEGNTAGVDIIANNPILIGANQSDTGQTRYRLRAGTGATLVVNGGIVHRNINDRLVTYNTAGNVTLNSVVMMQIRTVVQTMRIRASLSPSLA